MTRKDRFNPSKRVARYWEYKDELNVTYNSEAQYCRELLIQPCKIIFAIPMPKSWSKKEKAKKQGCPHLQTPDIDNLLKGFLDALFKQDDHIWSVWPEKVWAYEGKIIVRRLIV